MSHYFYKLLHTVLQTVYTSQYAYIFATFLFTFSLFPCNYCIPVDHKLVLFYFFVLYYIQFRFIHIYSIMSQITICLRIYIPIINQSAHRSYEWNIHCTHLRWISYSISNCSVEGTFIHKVGVSPIFRVGFHKITLLLNI